MKIDGTITLGSVLSMLTIICAMALAYGRFSAAVDAVVERLADADQAAAGREIRVRALEIGSAGTAAEIRSISNNVADIKKTLDRMTGGR